MGMFTRTSPADQLLKRLVEAEARLSSRPRSGYGSAHFRAKREYEAALKAAKIWLRLQEVEPRTSTETQ